MTAEATLAFVRDLSWDDVPADVRERIAWLCLDATAAAEAGRRLDGPRIAADLAAEAFGGDQATCLLDGRRVSAAGAAWANGTLMNAVDLDDGHSLAKGHPGAIIIPAALAVAELVGATVVQLTTAIAVGYEIGVRAAVQQHTRWPLFHSSGTWGSVGAAAAAAHLLQLSTEQIDTALGLAEYHAPTDLIMRGVASPTAAKDAMGWGAHVGVTSAMLAKAGFTCHRSEFVEGRRDDGLGTRWETLNTYVKPFPCCRWAHPALAAVTSVLTEHGVERLAPAEVSAITVRTFENAGALSRGLPTTSEQAQFNLAWPIAAMTATGRFDIDSITTDLHHEASVAMFDRIRIVVDPALTAEFPDVRRSEVLIELTDGRTLRSGLTFARGDADDPRWAEIVRAKFAADEPFDPQTQPPSYELGSLEADHLIHALAYARSNSHQGEKR